MCVYWREEVFGQQGFSIIHLTQYSLGKKGPDLGEKEVFFYYSSIIYYACSETHLVLGKNNTETKYTIPALKGLILLRITSKVYTNKILIAR